MLLAVENSLRAANVSIVHPLGRHMLFSEIYTNKDVYLVFSPM